MPSEESVILFMRKTAKGEKSCQSQISVINLDTNLFPDE